MLQQTRVATVIPYYLRFVERFPTAESMARAPEQEVLTLWAGLGYYTRARNLRRAAQELVKRADFPKSVEEIRALPGVGEYTAAAVASIVHGDAAAAVDGNVLRVMSRYTADAGEIRALPTRQRLREAAEKLLDRRRPGDFNQALMELGATVCLPRNPLCAQCPLVATCEGRRQGVEKQLPVKIRQNRTELSRLHLLIVEKHGRYLVRRSEAGGGGLAGFWEAPERRQLDGLQGLRGLGTFRHSITTTNYQVEVSKATVPRKPDGFVWKSLGQLAGMPVSTMTKKAFRLAGLTVTKIK